MQMNKTDLIKMVAEKANKPTKEVAEIIDSFFKELSQNLRSCLNLFIISCKSVG